MNIVRFDPSRQHSSRSPRRQRKAHRRGTPPAEPASLAIPACDLCGEEPGKWVLRGPLRDIVLCRECAAEHVPHGLAVASASRLLEWNCEKAKIPVVVIHYEQVLAERAERAREEREFLKYQEARKREGQEGGPDA